MKQLKRHLPEIEVDENDPFLNCKLGRKSIAGNVWLLSTVLKA